MINSLQTGKSAPHPFSHPEPYLFADAAVGAGDHVGLALAADLEVIGVELLGRGEVAALGVLREALDEPDRVSVE